LTFTVIKTGKKSSTKVLALCIDVELFSMSATVVKSRPAAGKKRLQDGSFGNKREKRAPARSTAQTTKQTALAVDSR